MPGMEYPAKGFAEVIGWVDDTSYVNREDITIILPILNGEVLDIDVASTFSGLARVDHLDG